MKAIYVVNRILSFFILCITVLGVLWFVSAVGIVAHDAINIIIFSLISFFPRKVIKDYRLRILSNVILLSCASIIAYHGIDYYNSKDLLPIFDIIKFFIIFISIIEVTKLGGFKKNNGHPPIDR